MSLHGRFIDRDSRETLVLLHGFMGSTHDWDALLARMARTFNWLVVDLPGHGLSRAAGRKDFKAQTFFSAFDGLLQRFGLNKIHLLGYSMGGRLALQWAVRFPHKIRSLILESAHPGLPDSAQRQARLEQDEALSRRLQTENFETFLQHWYAQPLFGHVAQHAKFPDLLRRRLENDVRGLGMALSGFSLGRQPSLWPELKKISFPVLILSGAADEKYHKIAREVCARNSNFQCQSAAECAHTVHFENPRWFADTVNAFLLKVRES